MKLSAARWPMRNGKRTLLQRLLAAVVNIISVGENHTEIMPRYAMSMKAAGDSMAENAATPMEAGTADFESHVTVVFEIV